MKNPVSFPFTFICFLMALILVIEAQNSSYTLTIDYSLSGAFCTITWYDGNGNEIGEDEPGYQGDCDHQTMGTKQYTFSSSNGYKVQSHVDLSGEDDKWRGPYTQDCTIHIHGSLDKWKFTPDSPCS
ncbi:hypothetical protein Glove_33g299 [Diversispora epigaea]|uniref:Uncharacterized protein n=1 Tax=Diversispora epigaea TaxID=1348612 RepID=A0A397JT65_9GLOM|nr:hypothetical protein Glove_33g299 [Diversispora epigaea]